jgi:hypothetical protein
MCIWMSAAPVSSPPVVRMRYLCSWSWPSHSLGFKIKSKVFETQVWDTAGGRSYVLTCMYRMRTRYGVQGFGGGG